MAQTLWDNMYIGINSANLLLQNAELYLPESASKTTYEDLSRTRTLVDRVKAFNSGATLNIQPKHLLRPIPQSHLDAIQRNGSALTPDQKQEEQNPGY